MDVPEAVPMDAVAGAGLTLLLAEEWVLMRDAVEMDDVDGAGDAGRGCGVCDCDCDWVAACWRCEEREVSAAEVGVALDC